MANLRTRWWLAAVATLITANSSASAQNLQPFGPTDIQTDWEWFAPTELGDFGETPDPNEGYFFTYERLNWNITTPPTSDHPFGGDWAWGNRFDIGYMSHDRGWLVSVFRMPRFETNDRNRTEPVVNYLSSSGGGEVMRTWRLDQLHRGSFLEPMIGIRYFQFDQDATLTEGSIRTYANVDNRIIGPQVGLRWFRQRERWNVAFEGRFFAGFNHQMHNFFNEDTFVPGGEIRLQATYEIFRKVALTFGYTGLFLTDGIGQEGIVEVNGVRFYNTTTTSHLFMNGINFGLVINR